MLSETESSFACVCVPSLNEAIYKIKRERVRHAGWSSFAQRGETAASNRLANQKGFRGLTFVSSDDLATEWMISESRHRRGAVQLKPDHPSIHFLQKRECVPASLL